ncbi:MAG: polysaccharide deacetylase family protein, partial [Clostridia bacterium]|nr:polysaccharide deacetylase family protein [Clostridia bacterium]
MKKRLMICAVSLLLCLASLTSCAGTGQRVGAYFREMRKQLEVEAELVLAEYRDILEFFEKHRIYIADFGVLDTAESTRADKEIYPVLKTTPHTEIVESLYNRAADGLKIYHYGDEEKVYAPHIATLTEYEKFGYAAVRNFDGMNFEQIAKMLEDAGIEYETEMRANPAPEGDVFAINYAGVTDGDVYYINPDVRVKLYVSAPKKAVIETDYTKNNIVYITFDDGPSEKSTLKLLDILDTYGVKASFFTTGTSLIKYPAGLSAIVGRGHDLGCHTVSHNYDQIYASTDAMREELLTWERIVTSAGVKSWDKLFRYPGGSVSKYMDDEKLSEM